MIKKKAREQVFRDPIYGYITVNYEVITRLIDSSVFQRLRRIRQLSGVLMAYHGAEHSRFSHSLGVYRNATKFLEITDINNKLTEREKLLFLTSALLHDIGHGPYSHAFEDVFCVNHEKIGARIIRENEEITKILDSVDKNFKIDVSSIILKKGDFPLIEQLISSQLDVDRLDYLLRDAYFTGTKYGNIDIDRLIRVARVIDNKLVFKISGIHAIENYLISRYHMYWQVYYHDVSRSYEVILEKIYLRIKDLIHMNYDFKTNITILEEVIKNPDNLKYYVRLDDFYINGLFNIFLDTEDLILRTLVSDFLNRNIWDYLVVSDQNLELIKNIKNSMTEEELKYFQKSGTVFQTTYKDDDEKMGDKIYILKEEQEISTLLLESKIISSMSKTSDKSDLKFFYRKK